MISIQDIRKKEQGIVVAGNHPGIVQAILDFDYACGKGAPSVVAIVTANRKAHKCFFGAREVLIPCVARMRDVLGVTRRDVSWLLNVQSGRRSESSTREFFEVFPDALGAHLFAEGVPEKHATDLIREYGGTKIIAGPSGVGLLVPGVLKLGAIGGIGLAQLNEGKLTTPGSVAVVATSGGMTNELITAVAQAEKRVSFAFCIGGDRFPVTSLREVLLLAERDSETKAIVYFGELGGVDEYEIVELVREKKLTKPAVAYIAGVVDEAFGGEHVQFGHAKALVAHKDESARAKAEALRAVGVTAPESFALFLKALRALPAPSFHDTVLDMKPLENRRASILSTRTVTNVDAAPTFVKGGKLLAQRSDFSTRILEALLDREGLSPTTLALGDAIFQLLIDHGGHVSGAVNTMVTARAGKDLVSSLAAGLLTVGPRFGGAVNEAARQWIYGVEAGVDAKKYVEESTKGGKLLSGIGHRKYRVGVPDPRVAALAQFATLLKNHPHYDFARAVEKVTTGKNGSLILNVDGVMAALFLDVLVECEGYSHNELQTLIEGEFFNALFVIPRTVGFIAHFMEQKKNDEGLFRLPDDLLFVREEPTLKKKSVKRSNKNT